MIIGKREIIPTVTTTAAILPVTDWDASVNFTTDAIEFPETQYWALDVEGYSGMTAGTPVINILCSNKKDGEYKAYKALGTAIDITVAANRVILDDSFSPRYMKIQYVSGGSTGTFSLILSK